MLAGQCSEPIQVAAGVNEVAEHARANTELHDVFTYPEDRLLTVNWINRVATVEVPVSDSANDETQVHFINKALRGQLKVCKALGPGSADLIGQSFYFDIREDGAAYDGIWITAAAQTQCKIVGYFPIGSVVDVQETCGKVLPMEQPNGDDHCNEFIDVSGEGEITIAPGINTVTITNTAKGLLEICKQLFLVTTQPTFRFRVDGGGVINVRAGTCSPPMRVSVGNHTVTELVETNYELDPDAPGNGITVAPADREVSRNLPTRTVTVLVPYGPSGETLVTYYNRPKFARIKVCKAITPGSADALSGKTFSYTVYVDALFGGTVQFTLGPIHPGECELFSLDGEEVFFPVLTAAGANRVVRVVENGATDATPGPGTFYVTGLGVTGNNRNFPVLTNCQPAAYSPTGQHCKTFPYHGRPGPRRVDARARRERRHLHQLGR